MSAISLYTKLNMLPDNLKKEAEDFIEFLLEKSKKSNQNTGEEEKTIKRKRGMAKGWIKMTPDFNDPLEDFKEYME